MAELTAEEEQWLEEQINMNEEEYEKQMYDLQNQLMVEEYQDDENWESDEEDQHNPHRLTKEERAMFEHWSSSMKAPHMPAPMPSFGGGSKSNTVCKFFLEGKCNRGQFCNFSHQVVTNNNGPSAPPPCVFFLQGNCRYGQSCRYKH